MPVVNEYEKNVRMDLWDIVKFQLVLTCYIRRVKNLTDMDYSCLALIAILGETEVKKFSEVAAENKIFGTPGSVRNALYKLQELTLIIISKQGKSKKKVSLHPELKIMKEGNILVKYKVTRVDPQEIKGLN